jgi:D-alanyl-lipoteichoic acid acyltransferase DltB (MBOAT superfamily)
VEFNSLAFLAFFAVVYGVYLGLARHLRLQNAWLLVASLFFYGYWDYRFLVLILFTIGVSHFAARAVHASAAERTRRRWVAGAVVANLAVLGFFKYYDFFSESAAALLEAFGMRADPFTLQVVLPVGISFYTFQALSYVVDVKRGRVAPARSVTEAALFISFFPQLVAGPIERAQSLLPQITSPRKLGWNAVNEGLYLIFAGYFKKVVIADNLALTANHVFSEYQKLEGVDLLVGILAFTLQIYCDFSGYSDIARGLAKLMGFELMVNFRLPYFARTPSEFWQRWHISLSTWLRDYLYVPLGGNRGGAGKTYRNLLLTMLLGGLWHGAAYNFLLWGAYHGAILVAYRAVGQRVAWRPPPSGLLASAFGAGQIAVMFTLTIIGWVIFRAGSLEQIGAMLAGLDFGWAKGTGKRVNQLLMFGLPLFLVQAWQYERGDLLAAPKLPPWVVGPLYGCMLAGIVALATRKSFEFIYFQF